MASPFKFFRKHQTELLVVIGLLTMVAFIILPSILQQLEVIGRSRTTANVVETKKYGALSTFDVQRLKERQHVLMGFFNRLVQAYQGKLSEMYQKRDHNINTAQILLTEDDFTEVDLLYYTDKIDALNIICNGEYKIIKDNCAFSVKLTGKDNIRKVFFSFNKELLPENIDFDAAYSICAGEIEEIKVPANLSERQKAMFYSCYFCALENYKEKDDFKGFMAGHHYLFPMRTYYRDSYYTTLPMYNGNLEKVKNEILTLTKGIANDGTCPSAVCADWSAFWGNHYDSPSFLAIMLYDYVRFSNDVSFLDLEIDGNTVLQKTESAL